MYIKDVLDHLEILAPTAYQESYDNAGLITGSAAWEVTGILITLDCIEAVVDEAIAKGANLVVAHHPIVFKGLKSITGKNYVERTLLKAIKNDIAIYAIHTNLDNVMMGVNGMIAKKLDLVNVRILVPKKETLTQLVTFVPPSHASSVLDALHQAGAGQIGEYKNCSFQVAGQGRFTPGEHANPMIGKAGESETTDEERIEVLFPTFLERKIIKALKSSHPYEEVAYYLTALANENQAVGAGMIGDLGTPMEGNEFLIYLKSKMNLTVIRHTKPLAEKIQRVAVCGGSGSFLLNSAIQSGAHAFVSADFKYHEFFDADNRIMIADIGHYESEVCTKELLKDYLTKKFSNFAINFSETVTNPISYLIK